jgi:hypothetical protein
MPLPGLESPSTDDLVHFDCLRTVLEPGSHIKFKFLRVRKTAENAPSAAILIFIFLLLPPPSARNVRFKSLHEMKPQSFSSYGSSICRRSRCRRSSYA